VTLATLRFLTECSIRPLTEIEVKQRRLGGRTQISTSGRKLVDGTPFGKSFVRPAADRPTLLVPSRKRIRSANEEASTLQLQWPDATDEDDGYDAVPEPELKRPRARNSNAAVRFISRNLESDDDEDDSSFHSGNLEDSEGDQDSEDSEGDEDSMLQSDVAEVVSLAEESSSDESCTDVPTAKSSPESSEDGSSEQLEV
jgi:hypothetical protein